MHPDQQISRAGRRLALSVLLALASIAGRAQPAASAPDAALFQLGGLFIDETMSMAADRCTERVPASKAAWGGAYREWLEVHRTDLQALAQARTAIENALDGHAPRGGPLNEVQYTMFRMQAISAVMYGLAGADDAKASQLCETLRTRFMDRRLADEDFERARNAALAALAALSPR